MALENPEYRHVHEEFPRHFKLIDRLGKVEVFSLERCPDVLLKGYLVRNTNAKAEQFILLLTTHNSPTFEISYDGPDRNLLTIEWVEEDELPDLPEVILNKLHVVLSNVGAGSKKISFLVQGGGFAAIPHEVRNIAGNKYLLIFQLHQHGPDLSSQDPLMIHGGLSSAKATVATGVNQKTFFFHLMGFCFEFWNDP